MLPENPALQQIQAYFANDKFATQAAGCTIVEGSRGHAVCEMVLDDKHRNAQGGVMGGAIFTLADSCLVRLPATSTSNHRFLVSNTIEFLSGAKGSKLIATCNADKSGRKLGFYTVDVADDTGRKVARMTAMGFANAQQNFSK